MLFQKRFHAGLADGSIDRTFRVWASPKVRVGGRYRVAGAPGVTVLVVEAVDSIALGEIPEREAARAGFADLAELRGTLERNARRRVTSRTRVFRVRFRLATESEVEAPPELTPAEAVARLEKMDRLSRRGPWTRAVLEAVARQPRVAASKLAPSFDRELRAFKADVRKLKKLGLTRSHEVGYELTPLGRRVLKRL